MIVMVGDSRLTVEFQSCGRWWTLPQKSNYKGVRVVRDSAIEFAKSQGATKGQISGLCSKMTREGYFVRETIVFY